MKTSTLPSNTHTTSRTTYRIGAGAGFAGDRLDPAVDLAQRGELDALVFEILAERTIALAQRRVRTGSGPGYDVRLVERIGAVLPQMMAGKMMERNGVILTNGGAADPAGGGRAVLQKAHELGQSQCRVAVVTGDDIADRLDPATCTVLETGEPLTQHADRLISANAYLGTAPLLEALALDPHVIIAGRTTDAALFLAPLKHRFGWADADWDRLAAGSVVGHLLECAGQLTGGYFADGVRKVVPGLAQLGFPYADVSADGSATLSKLPGTGGRLDRATCTEQLLYEVHDPARYLTPDVTLNMETVELRETGPSTVQVSGAQGTPPPDTLKVSLGLDGGFVATGEISYAGVHALERARMAAAIVQERWAAIYGRDPAALQAHLIGLTSCTPWAGLGALNALPGSDISPDLETPPEVRLRLAVQSFDRSVVVDLAREVEALYTNGPAGGGGVETSVRESVTLLSTLVPRELVEPRVEVLE